MIESYAILFFLALLSFNELFGKNIIFARKIFGPIIMLAMAVLCLIRGGIAGDYVTYKTSFEIIIDPNDFFYPTNYFYEPLYSLLQLCVKAVVDDFQVFCLVIGSIVLLLQYKFAMMYRPGKVLPTHKDSGIVSFSNGMVCIKRCYKNICYSSVVQGEYYFTIFFILWGLYRANIVTIRSSIALCICLYAIKYIEEKNI